MLYLPVYAGIAGTSVFNAPLFDIALQAIVQGLLTAIVALLLYGRMVSLLGATSGAAFVALTPVMTGLMGIPATGVTVTGFTVGSDNSVSATLNIAPTAAAGTLKIGVATPGGNSNTVVFTIN